MHNDRFDSLLKICAYEAITGRLLEIGQITTSEAEHIRKHISVMKRALVAVKPTTKHHSDENAA